MAGGLLTIAACLLVTQLDVAKARRWIANFGVGASWRLILLFWLGSLLVELPSLAVGGVISLGPITIATTTALGLLALIATLKERRWS